RCDRVGSTSSSPDPRPARVRETARAPASDTPAGRRRPRHSKSISSSHALRATGLPCAQERGRAGTGAAERRFPIGWRIPGGWIRADGISGRDPPSTVVAAATLGSMDLTTRYLGLTLANPFMPGASPLDDLDTAMRLEDAGASAIVMHSLFEEEIARYA